MAVALRDAGHQVKEISALLQLPLRTIQNWFAVLLKNPDWGPDGRITYITKRGGAQIAVIDPAKGEASVKLVTEPGNWEHPSWSRDSRNLVASRDRALFVVDTEMQGDVPSKPIRVFHAEGNWITPSWSK